MSNIKRVGEQGPVNDNLKFSFGSEFSILKGKVWNLMFNQAGFS
ncbi:MAG: hypothetical protein PVG20_08890 [Thioalkalispiraceae bacterium]